MKNIFFIILCLGIIPSFPATAQVESSETSTSSRDYILRLERKNSAKTKRFVRGDKVRILAVDDHWYIGPIEDLDPEEQTIVLPEGIIPIAAIKGFDTQRRYNWGKAIMWGGLSLSFQILVFSSWDLLIGLPYNILAPIASAIIAGGSFGIHKMVKHTYKRIGSKWQLKVLDLSFQ